MGVLHGKGDDLRHFAGRVFAAADLPHLCLLEQDRAPLVCHRQRPGVVLRHLALGEDRPQFLRITFRDGDCRLDAVLAALGESRLDVVGGACAENLLDGAVLLLLTHLGGDVLDIELLRECAPDGPRIHLVEEGKDVATVLEQGDRIV